MYPDAKVELDYESDLDLLIATILSAQCTDVRVNIVTKELFKECKTPEDYLALGVDELGKRIKSCGLWGSKSRNIIATSKMLIEKFGGQVPQTIEELMELPGVGRKTANVVASNLFGVPAIAVDTHVFRVSNRIGLSDGKTVDVVEKQLMEVIARDEWTNSHHRIIFHGRKVCKARNPLCPDCGIKDICLYYRGE